MMEQSALLGMVLGDSYISLKGVLVTRHCLQQRPYLIQKLEFCRALYPHKTFNLVEVPSQNAAQFGVCDAKKFKIWRSQFYPQGKKVISTGILRRLTLQGLAFWYCDDGSLSVKKRNGVAHALEARLSTCCSFEEAQLVCDIFKERWDLNATVCRDHKLFSVRWGTKTARKVSDLLAEYVIPSMQYKLAKPGFEKGVYVSRL